jgi:hypothetical protein
VKDHERRVVLLSLVFSLICKELDLAECGHEGFFRWEKENEDIIQEIVTPEIVSDYFAAVGEQKTAISRDIVAAILARMQVTA